MSRFYTCAGCPWGSRRRVGMLVLLLIMTFGLAGAIQGQPTLTPVKVWSKALRASRYGFYFDGFTQLSPTRLVLVGTTSPTSPTRLLPSVASLLLVDQNGDSLTTRQFPHPGSASPRGTAEAGFDNVILDPDSGFLAMATTFDSVAAGYRLNLTHHDTLGRITWQRRYLAPLDWGSSPPTGRALPDGYLMQIEWFDNSNNSYAHLWKLDRRGNLLWDKSYPLNEWSGRMPPLLCRDGSYVVCNLSFYNVPGPWQLWDYDYHLLRYAPDGTLLHEAFVGPRRSRDYTGDWRETPDGGLILVGSTRPAVPVGQESTVLGQVIQLDSLFRKRWSLTLAPQAAQFFTYASTNFNVIQPLTNGRFWLAGGTATATSSNINTYRIRGLIAEIVPPERGDTLGQVVQQVLDPESWFYRAAPQSDGSAYFWGQNWREYDVGGFTRSQLTKYTGLGTPWVPDLCATPPVADSVARFARIQQRPDSLAFTWAASGVRPGPRYAEISLVRWDFGDGTTATGWNVTHRFATPRPVRVRVCATNNLFCQVCQELYPFGIPTAALTPVPAPLVVSVYPNPSATGVFTVAGAGGATAVVVDAVGRVVWHGKLGSGPEARLSLAAEAAGIYALRLTWPDGRTLTKRLVR